MKTLSPKTHVSRLLEAFTKRLETRDAPITEDDQLFVFALLNALAEPQKLVTQDNGRQDSAEDMAVIDARLRQLEESNELRELAG